MPAFGARRLLARSLALATCTAVLTSGVILTAPPASAATAGVPPVFVSEIVADTASYDDFEYFEVTNTTDAPLSLADAGITFAYTYVDSADTARDVPLTLESDVTLAPGESAALWLSYTSGNVDSFARTVEEFRAATGAPETTQVVRITGQAGMANGGGRGIRVSDASGILTWSYYPSDSMAVDRGVDFRVPAAVGQPAPVLASQSPMSPGTVVPEALVPGGSEPTPEPEPEPETPEDVSGLQPDPSVTAAALQVTEVLPDSSNVGSADGYEFIEVYNATSEPIDFSDYAITYLYPQDYETNTNEALWPATPADVTIDAGDTLVLWIKNGQNDDLTDADFNAKFGSDLTMGDDLVEVFSGGMANGSPRGIDIRTNTGFSLNRAYYNMDGADDTAADQGIRYAASDDLALQRILDTAPASPGRVQVDQVPGGLAVPADDTAAPVITDRTTAEIDPAAGFTIDLGITDDTQVRTVTVELRNDVDEAVTTLNLLHAGDDAYRSTVNAADLMGKAWYEYTVRASDGTNETVTEPRRVPVAGAATDPVRLNVADGDFVGGTATISAAGEAYPPALELSVDGTAVETRASLESEPSFVFEVSQTDFYFRNGVRIGEDVLHIFDEGTYENTVTMAVPVSLEYVTRGEPLTVSIWAGTKAGPWIDPNENNDDFVVSGMRLILPDGRTLRPAGYDDPSQIISMGDSAGKHEYFDSTFTLPEDAYTALAHDWDTTTVVDGGHEVAATDGTNRAAAVVQVDNTAPTVTPSLEEGRVYQGEIVLDAEVADGAGSGVADVMATLDGEPIELGTVTSSVELAAGEHVFAVTATDAIGNATESTVTFTVPAEQPGADGLAPDNGAEVEAGQVILQATVTDPTGDPLDVSFREGERFELGDKEITATSGTTQDASAIERDDAGGDGGDNAPAAAAVAEEELETTQGLEPVTSGSALPYYRFDVAVPADAGADASARVTWDGTADGNSQVILYALAADGSAWVEIDRHRTATDGEQFQLAATVPVANHARDGVIRVLVQHSEGFAGADHSTRETAVTPYHPDDTPRSEYDFSIAWESDTQYYNEEFYDHQVAIHDFVLDQREEQNIQYLIHTGDIVDDYDQMYQWHNADPQYQRLDDAGLPYGVLAGNHDVGNQLADYTNYGTYFGEQRYADNPWYGGSYENNRGHYDLFSAGGIDFIAVYMGWDPQQDAIDWMNDVLARYPERVAIVNLHEFMLTTGGLGPIPQQIMDEVVATNPNVKMVLSGHYHDAFTRVDEFDDNGDGVADRKVHSMLFDYQGLPEGGQGFLRLLQFDNEGQQMRVRTFSPSLHQYNSDEASLLGPAEDPYMYQDFALSYADLGIVPGEKTLATTAFTAEILTMKEIGSLTDVASGTVAAVEWQLEEPGEYSWYVHTADPYGGVQDTPVRTFTLVEAAEEPGDGEGPGGGNPGGGSGEDPGTGDPDTENPGAQPTVVLEARAVAAGDALRVNLHDFPGATRLSLALEPASESGAVAAASFRVAAAETEAADSIALGEVTTDALGTVVGHTVTIPASVAPGEYTFVVTGGGVTAGAPLTVTDAAAPGGASADQGGALAATGASVAPYLLAALLLLGAGAAALLIRRRIARG